MLTLVGNIHTTKFVTYKRQKDAPVVDRSLELIPVHRPTHILLKLPSWRLDNCSQNTWQHQTSESWKFASTKIMEITIRSCIMIYCWFATVWQCRACIGIIICNRHTRNLSKTFCCSKASCNWFDSTKIIWPRMCTMAKKLVLRSCFWTCFETGSVTYSQQRRWSYRHFVSRIYSGQR